MFFQWNFHFSRDLPRFFFSIPEWEYQANSIPFPFQNGNYSDFHSIPIPEWKLSNNSHSGMEWEWNGNGMRNGIFFSHSPFPKAWRSAIFRSTESQMSSISEPSATDIGCLISNTTVYVTWWFPFLAGDDCGCGYARLTVLLVGLVGLVCQAEYNSNN